MMRIGMKWIGMGKRMMGMNRMGFSSENGQQVGVGKIKRDEFDYLHGYNSVTCALKAGKRSIHQLFLSSSEQIAPGSKLSKLIDTCRQKMIPVSISAKEKLERMARTPDHQNVVLKCNKLLFPQAPDVQNWEDGVYIYCDKITDPQNLGAIFRSAYYFGAKGVFTGRKYHCPLNQTVSKTSAGALQLQPVYLVKFSYAFLHSWKEKHKGTIISTSVSEPYISAASIQKEIPKEKLKKVLILMGSEGNGLSPQIDKHGDYRVKIEGGPQANMIGSLNVNAALAVLLYDINKSRM